MLISILWDYLVTPINIKPSLSTNHHTKIEIPALLMQVFIANLMRKLLAGLILTLTFWDMGLEVSPAAFLWDTASVRWQEKGKCVHPLKSEAVLSGWYHILRISRVLSVQSSAIPSVHPSSTFRNLTGEIVTNGAHSRASEICTVNQSYNEQSLLLESIAEAICKEVKPDGDA